MMCFVYGCVASCLLFFSRQYTRPDGQVMCFMCVMLTIYDRFACSLIVYRLDLDRAGPGDRRMLR